MAYGTRRPSERVFVEITRVAKDGSWVDIRCYTWAKRMRCWPPDDGGYDQLRHWGATDLEEQMADHMAKLREEGKLQWQRPASAEDRCCMGGTLGPDELRCWEEALPHSIWCPVCAREVNEDGPACMCPGCQAARVWGRSQVHRIEA